MIDTSAPPLPHAWRRPRRLLGRRLHAPGQFGSAACLHGDTNAILILLRGSAAGSAEARFAVGVTTV